MWTGKALQAGGPEVVLNASDENQQPVLSCRFFRRQWRIELELRIVHRR